MAPVSPGGVAGAGRVGAMVFFVRFFAEIVMGMTGIELSHFMGELRNPGGILRTHLGLAATLDGSGVALCHGVERLNLFEFEGL